MPSTPTEIEVTQIRPSTSAYQIIGTNSGATQNEYLTLTAGTNVTITPSGTSITIAATGSGTVGTGTSGQIAVYNGSTSITSGITASMNNTKLTNLANGTVSTDAMAFGQNKIIQVVSFSTTTAFATTSNSFQTTNLSASITPTSSSNKILIIASGSFVTFCGSVDVWASLFRGSTNLGDSSNGMSERYIETGTATNEWIDDLALSWVDNPATTSSITYSLKIRSDGVRNITFGPSSEPQSIILMEVAS